MNAITIIGACIVGNGIIAGVVTQADTLIIELTSIVRYDVGVAMIVEMYSFLEPVTDVPSDQIAV